MTSRILSGFALFFIACALASAQVGNAASPTPMTMPMKPAGASPTPTPTADPAEAAFIADVTKVLQAKYPTTQSASKAGYFQMTRLEDDGTAIWFNGQWGSAVSKYAPNFLWYDKNDKLAGLDYQYEVSVYPSPPGQSVYPVMPSRWTTIDAHMHLAYKLPDGTLKLRGAQALPNQTRDPTAAQLRAANLLPPGATLLWALYHPKTWDLGFWLVPNPTGPFADLNPLVKP
jgi:hypothetical protein